MSEQGVYHDVTFVEIYVVGISTVVIYVVGIYMCGDICRGDICRSREGGSPSAEMSEQGVYHRFS